MFDPTTKRWRFKDKAIIDMFVKKFPNTVVDIEKETAVPTLWDKKAKDQPTKEEVKKIDYIEGINGNLYEYQKEGVQFLLDSNGRALLCDSPGVGKSLQALGYVVSSKHKKTLIVCPASVKYSWENEIKKWTELESMVVSSQTDISEIPDSVNCVIINYDVLKKHLKDILKHEWDCLIGDEIQYIKNAKAIRSSAFKMIASKIPSVIMLTGTPMMSRPIEMWNMLTILDKTRWNNYYAYAKRYCGGRMGNFGYEASGATNLVELSQKLKPYFLRRTKDQVLKELPKKNPIDFPVEMSPVFRKQYDLIEEDLAAFMKQRNIADAEIKKKMQAEKLVKINMLRKMSVMAKLDAAEELIDSILDSGEKILIFSNFRDPLTELFYKYQKISTMIIGTTPVSERGDIVRKFQEDPNTRIFFGGMLSAGVGITLTAASNVIILDLPWRPSDLEQAVNRAHRPSAVYESLNIITMHCKHSIDDFMSSVLKAKKDIIDKVIDGKGGKLDSDMIDEYIKKLEERKKH